MNAQCWLLSIFLIRLIACDPMLSQQPHDDAAHVVDRIMKEALSNCYSVNENVKIISWQPPTQQEVAAIKKLGDFAVRTLSSYITARSKDGFTQLIAVKFLIALDLQSTIEPLELAISADQWEVTRAQALSGLFAISREDARPFIVAALRDGSQLVRQRAQELFLFYGPAT